MAEITLNGEVRKLVGKRAKTLRKDGKVPGIFYVHGEDNITIAVAEAALRPLIYTSEAHIVNLKLDSGVEHSCILRDIQFDPITDRPIHFDLQGVRAEENLTVEIPVILVGTPKGVKDGGTMQRVLHRLRVECLPRYIPEHIEVNVENLGINESIHVKDIKVENVTILENENSTVVAVVPPTVLKEEVPAAAPVEEITEPEVIGKGKKEEEEEGEEEAPKQAAGAAKKEEKKAEGGKSGEEK
ncbi:MAG: 50S ribosomal protein L25 [Bacteroidota bacterium]